MPLAAGSLLGPYEIQSQIGAGGMGEVYKARDTRLNRTVAVKISSEQFSERFAREAKTVATLNHPYICTLHDVGPDYLVMEFVDGTPLSGPLPLAEAVEIAKKIAEALDHAHRRGVVHRDLKPANILVTKAGGLKLLDFGLAKIQSAVTENDATRTMGLTQQGTILGTLQYMSPEQVEGQEADARSDIFSFGAVLHELLTGQKAFSGKTSASILASVMKDHPVAPPELVGPLEPVLRRCLAKDPDARFQSAADLMWAVGQAVSPPVSPPATAPTPPKPRSQWLPWALAAAALIGAAALAFWPEPVPELQALRYTIEPPPGYQFANNFAAGTPSPDGRFIVFAAAPAGATNTKAAGSGQSLWLRPTDSLEARPLPGTENGNFPFWSPDGKSIGFWSISERKLKRVEAVGGAPQVLCEAATFEGGTWSKEGVILFSSGNIIQRVAAAGGKPEPVTKAADGPPKSHRDPQFLPDGQSFLYRIVSPDEKVNGIYAATLTKPDPPVLLVAGTDRKATYAPPFEGRPGHLLWLRDQTLVAQRFDPETLKLEGDPVPVAEEVAMQGKGGKGAKGSRRAAFWISQNGLLAYHTGASVTGRQLQMTWISRDGKQRDAVGPADDYGNQFRLSPDGKHVALNRTVSDNGDIWLYEFERGVLSRLTFDPAVETNPVWSPDSRQVAYMSARSGPPQLFRKDAGGAGQEERLYESQVPELPMDWSRDGKFLLFGQNDPKTLPDLWVLPMDANATPRKPTVFLQTPFAEQNGRISPDGKWVAYQSDETGTNQVYIRAMPGGPAGQWQASNAGGQNPRWRSDGKELFYHPAQGAVMAAGIKLLPDRVDIETPHELFRYAGPNQAYEPAPDGQRFLVLLPPAAVDDETDSGTGALKIVSNWQALLK